MHVVLGTVVLLLAIAVALFGFAVSQGERDLLSHFLTMSVVLAAIAVAFFGWSVVTWYQRAKGSVAKGGATVPVPVSGPLSTVLVLGVVLAFVGLPMLVDGVSRLTRSGAHAQPLLSGGHSVAELPWLFAVGLVLVVSALTWKGRRRRARRRGATST
jgi:hypothetical protein